MANIDISSLSNAMVTAQALNNLILVWPQEQTGYQPQAQLFDGKSGFDEKFLFHYEGENTVTLSSEITDHYVEDNYAAQDHIALAPDIIMTTGFIGELNDVTPAALEGVKTAAEKLGNLSAYEPALSVSAIQAYNLAFQAYQALEIASRTSIPSWNGASGLQSNGPTSITAGETTQQFVSSVNLRTQNKQQIAFQKFYGYRKARTLFTVQTPWAIFKDCAIMELVATQDAQTQFVSSFRITFKPIQVAYTGLTPNVDQYQGRAYYHAAPATDSGTQAVDYRQGSFEDVLNMTA